MREKKEFKIIHYNKAGERLDKAPVVPWEVVLRCHAIVQRIEEENAKKQ